MHINLLRELLDDALNEENEENRVGSLWVHCDHYDESIELFREVFLNKSIRIGFSTDCRIERVEQGFLIEDLYGRNDIFTIEEMDFLIDLWLKTFQHKVNYVYMDPID